MEIKLPWKNEKVKGKAGSGENLSPKVCVWEAFGKIDKEI